MKAFMRFYQKTVKERLALINAHFFSQKNEEEISTILHLPEQVGNMMVENYLFNYELPLGVATNFLIDSQPYLIPMAVEEPSVIAAASSAAKLLGNMTTTMATKDIVGQIILHRVQSPQKALTKLEAKKDFLLDEAKKVSANMVRRGGGPQKLWFTSFHQEDAHYLTLFLLFDPQEAMGANAINTVLEALIPKVEAITGEQALMGILSNYATEALAKATVKLPLEALDKKSEAQAFAVAKRIEAATQYANTDPYRAVTHNKGIMNGVDPILIATGNDWRAVEAGVHAYAVRQGRYQSLSSWQVKEKEGVLVGELTLPMQVATLGGTLSVHPMVSWAHTLLGKPEAKRLARIITAVGLAQNFSALRALVTSGIQKGHMNLHARQLAMQVGATEEEIPVVVAELNRLKLYNIETAQQALQASRKNKYE